MPAPWSRAGEDGLAGLRGFTDCDGNTSSSGSPPIEAFGAGSGRAFRCDDRLDPDGEPSDGTVDSLAPAGSSIAGSDDKVRDDAPAPAGSAGPLMTGPNRNLIRNWCTGPIRSKVTCKRDEAHHALWPLQPASGSRVRACGCEPGSPGTGAAGSGPSLSGPSSISLPGLKTFPTSRVGPSSSVDRKHGAERQVDLPR